jgi:prevent-host-death family protein
MAQVDTATARRQLADLVSRVRYAKERITLTRYGKPFAALVPIEDLVALRSRKSRRSPRVRVKGPR